MNFIKKHIIIIAGIIFGGIAGLAYWHFIGCNTGSCNITSIWYNSTLYGVVLGGISGSMLGDLYKKKKGN